VDFRYLRGTRNWEIAGEKEFNHRGTEANLYAKRCGEWIITVKTCFNKLLSTPIRFGVTGWPLCLCGYIFVFINNRKWKLFIKQKEFNHRGTEANLYAKQSGYWIILVKSYFNKSLSTQLNLV
jgi:hypothetical protein